MTAETQQIFDTATRTLRPFRPLREGHVSIYLCGATPQSAPHIGHLRSGVAFDIVRRWFAAKGYDVAFVRNVTDIDDKILNKAAEHDRPWWEWVSTYEREFTRAYNTLGVLPPSVEPRATGHVTQMIDYMQRLIDAGFAYASEGSVYFDVAAWTKASDDYGSLSGNRVEEMNQGESDVHGKRGSHDFALWKAAKPGEPSWPTPWGPGRPGWHIECSVMAARLNDGPLTVQAGGNDLIFPHHEFSAGHTAAVSGHRLADHYAHTGMVGLEGVKMSKSLGNLVLVSKLTAAGRDPRAIRAVILDHHYRDDWSFEHSDLDRADQRLAAWEKALGHTSRHQAEDVVARIRTALANDLDAPAALLALDEWAAAADASAKGADAADAEAAGLVADAVNALLGIELKPAQS